MAGFGVAGYSANRGDGTNAGSVTANMAGRYGMRSKLELLRSELENERSSFLTHWRDLSDFILPRRTQFQTSDSNRGERRNLKLLDNTPTLAARTLRSGMMAGVTSPARPWFRLTTPDPDLAESGAVKSWLHIVTQRMSSVFLKSNLYKALPIVYGDMGTFGTAAMSVEEDLESTIRCTVFPVGSYMISCDDKGRVRTFFREYVYTTRQVVGAFGKKLDGSGVQRDTRGEDIDWTNISDSVKNDWMNGNRETRVDICHAIYPNDDYVPGAMAPTKRRYRSVYYEKGSGDALRGDADRMLSDSGFHLFPVLAPRWETTGQDVYGTDCPGMSALGDAKQLQTGERRGLQAMEKMVNPPMTGPTSMRGAKASILPGDLTLVDIREGQKGFQPAHEVQYHLQQHEIKQDQVRGRIRRAFYEDLFLMLATDIRNERATAREIDERHEEKLLALGPVLEQLNQDLLDPLIDLVFDYMLRQGQIPEPPEELRGQDLRVEYISIMAQAQKLVGLSGLDRLRQVTLELATAFPDVGDKFDSDQYLDAYGDLTSVPPGVIRPDEQVDARRASRAQAQQAAVATEQAAAAATAARDLASADMTGDNALTRIASAAQGGALTPQV
jgi:hypothetical protein